jgi:hypothetical protein
VAVVIGPDSPLPDGDGVGGVEVSAPDPATLEPSMPELRATLAGEPELSSAADVDGPDSVPVDSGAEAAVPDAVPGPLAGMEPDDPAAEITVLVTPPLLPLAGEVTWISA